MYSINCSIKCVNGLNQDIHNLQSVYKSASIKEISSAQLNPIISQGECLKEIDQYFENIERPEPRRDGQLNVIPPQVEEQNSNTSQVPNSQNVNNSQQTQLERKQKKGASQCCIIF